VDGEAQNAELAYGDLVLRLDGTVIEMLSIARDKPLRVHVNHALVSLQQAKHGIDIRVGTDYRHADTPGQGPLVTEDRPPRRGAVHRPGRGGAAIHAFFDEAERRRVTQLGPVSY
jgi:hypothetical protein